MQHHSRLTNGESNKDTNRVRRNKCSHHSICADEKQCGSESNDDDSCAVGKTVTALANLSGKVAIDRQDACKLWPAVKSRVCGKQQDSGSCNLEHGVEWPTPK